MPDFRRPWELTICCTTVKHFHLNMSSDNSREKRTTHRYGILRIQDLLDETFFKALSFYKLVYKKRLQHLSAS